MMLGKTSPSRLMKDRVFARLCQLAAIAGVVILVFLVFGLFKDGFTKLNWQFVSSFPSRFAARAGIKAALVGTLWIIIVTMAIAIPIGIAAGIYLEEVAKKSRLTRLIELNIANLAGVPSIIYGLLGLAMFVRWLSLGRSILAGSLTMSLLILPMVIITTQEALRAVPRSVRDGSLALGASNWQTIMRQTLPSALPGIMTGIILAISRAIGETAPIVTIGAITFVTYLPTGIRDTFTALPIQIFNWTSRPQAAFHTAAAGAICVLLILLFCLNLTAIIIRQRARRRLG